MEKLELEFKEDSPLSTIEHNDNIFKVNSFSLKELVIISDFDYTLTKRFSSSDENNRVQYLCGFGFYDHCPNLPESFRKGSEQLKEKYIKYENDLSVPYETRDKYTKILYEEDLRLIAELHLDKSFLLSNLEDTIKKKPFYFRKGVKKFIEFIINNKIPFVIISGGIKETIEATLELLIGQPLPSNIQIISNEFIYDEKNKTKDFKTPLIYTFNKAEIISHRIKEIIKEEDLKNKEILFLGDHINDIDAIKDLKPKDKVGIVFNNYFNQYKYLEKYDCVINNEGSFDYINELLSNIK